MLSTSIRSLIPQQASGLFEPALRVASPVRDRVLPAHPNKRRLPHLHRFRFAAEDQFSSSSLYACRCGVVRHGL